MSRIPHALLLALALAIAAVATGGALSGSPQGSAGPLKDEILVCRNDVLPEGMQQANASFSAIYRLNTGGLGEVETVTRLRDAPWSDKGLVDCLRQWRFPAALKEVTVVLNWKHGAGWTSISITIPGFPTRVIKTPSYEDGYLP